MVEPSDNITWYKGPTLAGALDNFKVPKRPTKKPLRIPIQDVYQIGGIGTVPVGRVETGVLNKGTMVAFSPGGAIAECKSIEAHKTKLEEGLPGMNIGFNVRLSTKDIKKGYVAGDANNNPPSEAEKYQSHVIVMNHPGEIKAGYQPVVDVHTAHVSTKFEELLTKNDRRSGKLIEENPKFLKNGDSGKVIMTPSKPLCVEEFSKFPPLGRFVVRDMKATVAVGVIQEVTRKAVTTKKKKT